MDEFKVYDRFSYKYRLLYCLMLNYYRNRYADNKFKGKIMVVGSCKKELIRSYDEFYSTLKNFTQEDIKILRRFISSYDEQLKMLFSKIHEKHISYKSIINDIKEEYTVNQSMYYQFSYRENTKKVPNDINVIFIEMSEIGRLLDKHVFREIFIPEYYSLSDKNANNGSTLCYAMKSLVKEIYKTKEVLNSNNAQETDFLSLSIYLNSYDGLDIEDEIITLVKDDNFEDDE